MNLEPQFVKIIVALESQLVLQPLPSDTHFLRAPVVLVVEELHEVGAGSRRREPSSAVEKGFW